MLNKIITGDEFANECSTYARRFWLEQYFGLSRQAILYRLKNEGKIDSKLYNKMQVDVQYSAAKLGYDTDLYKPKYQKKNISN